MVTFVDQHRATYGVEPICAVLPIAPSTYFLRKTQQPEAAKRSAGARRDDDVRAAIQRVWDDNEQVYGPRKVWRQLRREGRRVARCTVERLMREMGPRPRMVVGSTTACRQCPSWPYPQSGTRCPRSP